jgi:rare lipoprotein A (peptidoglycan hydrolase)
MSTTFRKRYGAVGKRLAPAWAAVNEKWADCFGVYVPGFVSRLTIAMVFALAAAMFGCSSQGGPQTRSFSPALHQSHSSVPPGSRVEVASWYGPGLAGHTTSTGETFNPNELTAASKTLPIGSRVRVTNPDNGRSVVVRINDRGPFVRRRSLDLSHRAAREIGLAAKGVGRVRVSVAGATSHDAPIYATTRGRSTPISPASNDPRPVYIRSITYHQRTHRASRRRRISHKIGAWLASAWPF